MADAEEDFFEGDDCSLLPEEESDDELAVDEDEEEDFLCTYRTFLVWVVDEVDRDEDGDVAVGLSSGCATVEPVVEREEGVGISPSPGRSPIRGSVVALASAGNRSAINAAKAIK